MNLYCIPSVSCIEFHNIWRFILDCQALIFFMMPAFGRVSTKNNELVIPMKLGVILRCTEFKDSSSSITFREVTYEYRNFIDHTKI